MLGCPGLVFLWAFSRSTARELTLWNRALGDAVLRRFLIRPWVASIVHALPLWLGHAPALFQSTLVSEGAQATQHLSFLGTARIFWQAGYFGPQRRLSLGPGIACPFATIVQSGALGALISRQPYPDYAATTSAWGLTPREDEQLGGFIRWVPGGRVYIVVAPTLAARWLRASDAIAPLLPLPGSVRELR